MRRAKAVSSRPARVPEFSDAPLFRPTAVGNTVLFRVGALDNRPKITELYRDSAVTLTRYGKLGYALRFRRLQRGAVPLPRMLSRVKSTGLFYSVAAEVGAERQTEVLFRNDDLSLLGFRIDGKLREYLLAIRRSG